MSRQAEFAAALRDATHPSPDGLLTPDGGSVRARFNVYRNTVAASLVAALREGFPVVDRLVGAEFFDAMAAAFVRVSPPDSPLLFRYGAAFPDWIERFPPAATVPYLADIARLELALREAYHAADATPIDPARLSTLSPSQLLAARPRLAPAVRLVPSRFPIVAIWRANRSPGAQMPGTDARGALVTRPGFDPAVDAVTAPEAACLAALLGGACLEAAFDAAAARDARFDLAPLLSRLLSRDALVDLVEDIPE